MLKTMQQQPQVNSQATPAQPEQRGYQRILVAIDYLNSSPKVFRQALDMASLAGSRLMVFHCLQGDIPHNIDHPIYLGPYAGVYSVEMLEMEERLLKEAMEQFHLWLNKFTQQAAEKNIIAETTYRHGNPGEQICALATEWEADMILVGRQGKTGLSELLLGSVSNYVVHHAHCAVLVVQ
ncbi:MAG: universal stress protein [Microcystaceae cyanobacterium]